MCVTHENSNCVLNLMLGQPGKVLSSRSLQCGHVSSWLVAMQWNLGGGGQEDAHWDSDITFIYTI